MSNYPSDAGLTRRPDKNIVSTRQFRTTSVQFGGGYKKEFLNNRRRQRRITLNYGAITETDKIRIETFYNDRSGSIEYFDFDLAHINESGTLRVQFEGRLSYTQINTFEGVNYYNLSFTIVEV